MAKLSKNTIWMIAAAVAVLVIVVVILAMNKKKKETEASATTGNTGGMSAVGNYGLSALMTGNANLNYTGATQGVGESNYAFIMRRMKEGWKF